MTSRFGRNVRPDVFAAILLVPLFACASGAKRARPDPVDPSMPNHPVSTIDELFVGRFPGVTVDRTTGGGLKLRIRGGNSSFNNAEEPLLIVDEVPLPQGNDGIVFLNPSDIQRIEVLKNPADVAVYGIRGANGVIKITTKLRGRK